MVKCSQCGKKLKNCKCNNIKSIKPIKPIKPIKRLIRNPIIKRSIGPCSNFHKKCCNPPNTFECVTKVTECAGENDLILIQQGNVINFTGCFSPEKWVIDNNNTVIFSDDNTTLTFNLSENDTIELCNTNIYCNSTITFDWNITVAGSTLLQYRINNEDPITITFSGDDPVLGSSIIAIPANNNPISFCLIASATDESEIIINNFQVTREECCLVGVKPENLKLETCEIRNGDTSVSVCDDGIVRVDTDQHLLVTHPGNEPFPDGNNTQEGQNLLYFNTQTGAIRAGNFTEDNLTNIGNHSAAFGFHTEATGIGALAFGNNLSPDTIVAAGVGSLAHGQAAINGEISSNGLGSQSYGESNGGIAGIVGTGDDAGASGVGGLGIITVTQISGAESHGFSQGGNGGNSGAAGNAEQGLTAIGGDGGSGGDARIFTNSAGAQTQGITLGGVGGNGGSGGTANSTNANGGNGGRGGDSGLLILHNSDGSFVGGAAEGGNGGNGGNADNDDNSGLGGNGGDAQIQILNGAIGSMANGNSVGGNGGNGDDLPFNGGVGGDAKIEIGKFSHGSLAKGNAVAGSGQNANDISTAGNGGSAEISVGPESNGCLVQGNAIATDGENNGDGGNALIRCSANSDGCIISGRAEASEAVEDFNGGNARIFIGINSHGSLIHGYTTSQSQLADVDIIVGDNSPGAYAGGYVESADIDAKINAGTQTFTDIMAPNQLPTEVFAPFVHGIALTGETHSAETDGSFAFGRNCSVKKITDELSDARYSAAIGHGAIAHMRGSLAHSSVAEVGQKTRGQYVRVLMYGDTVINTTSELKLGDGNNATLPFTEGRAIVTADIIGAVNITAQIIFSVLKTISGGYTIDSIIHDETAGSAVVEPFADSSGFTIQISSAGNQSVCATLKITMIST